MPITEAQRQARSKTGARAAALRRSPDDPRLARELAEARREYRILAAEQYIRKLVDAAPPLSAEQRDKLAVLLRPARSGGSTG